VKRRLLTLVMAAAISLASAGTATAITWGESDGDGHPHVVAMALFQNGQGPFLCSGTLLTPAVVITAGHCAGFLDENGVLHANDMTYVTNAPDIAQLTVEVLGPIYGGDLLAFFEGEFVKGEAIPHPALADFTGPPDPDTFDIGLVKLSEDIDVPDYGVLPTLGQFDSLSTTKGPPGERMVEVVGYGLVGTIPAFSDSSIFERRVGYSTIINSESANVGTQNFLYTNSPGFGTGSGGTCSGDSGGPAFWVDPVTGATNLIVGVNSFGIAALCNGNDYQLRTDTSAVLEFVNSYLH
jgi:hypothetical protein